MADPGDTADEACGAARNMHQIVILGELKDPDINRPFLVLLKPNKKATEKSLPGVGTKCAMHICGVKLLLSDDDIERRASACAVALPGYFDDADEDLSEIGYARQISEMIRENHAIDFAVEEIESLRYTGNSHQEVNRCHCRVADLAKAKLRSSASDFDHTSPPSTDKRLAWKAVRFPVSVQGLPDFWQIYLVTKALQPPKDAYEKLVTPLSERKSIDTNLVVPPVPDDMRIPDLIASKLDNDDQLLNVVVRPIESTKQTISVYFRQCSHLHSLPARMFYGNDMLSQNPTREHEKDYMTLVGHVRSVIDPANSIKPSKDGRFRVKFRGAIEKKSGSSFRNTSHAGWCLDKAIAITKTGARCIPPRGDEKAKVLIICLYAEQLLEYKSRIREMVESGISRSIFESIDLYTLDSSRGKEADIVFVDFVRTEDVGFCNDAHRVCQSLTRSTGCEIILMNESMTFRRRSKRLEYILDHVPNVVTQECYEYCGDHRHTTEDCSRPERCIICEGMEEHPRARCPDTYCPNCRQKGHAVSACAQPRRAQKKLGKRK